MFKWNEQFQTAKDDLKKLSSSKSVKEFEKNMEIILEKLSTNPQFLNALSLILNTQSQIKSLMNYSFERLWKNLQLPNKKDQERTLYLLHEMQFKIHQMQKDMNRLNAPPTSVFTPRKERPTGTRPISVLNQSHNQANTPVPKLV